ncbi:protein phosphatase 1 regulatory subunit 37 [Cyprinodon tularosa]|uniref:protein phosphatase 1 regulatory subunit 37 n=1 Tax=Cyprinodon tularosa TaxID=77115 RepID=UPI0018E263FE|nr:protein phosphatase 1 regulatory subunit 37 [Cyprinodon tularosa]XP_038162312.1 protein phosphatase 1 regulatory subunit 37 [Cyprinodon tularosa]
MNFEEQHLDLCNVKTKAFEDDDHHTTNSTEGVTPRILELMTDSDLEKETGVPTEASETCLMPQLTDNLHSDGGDKLQKQDTLEIDEVNGNEKSCPLNTPAVDNPSDLISSNDEQHTTVKEEEVSMKGERVIDYPQAVEVGDDCVDMDIGVDLSLDESGVLESESTNVTPISANILDSKSSPQDVPAGRTAEGQANANKTCSTEASVADRVGLYPLVEEGGEKHKLCGKRVTFPSDDDIVSGAVEPKDPWRHAQNVTVEEIISSYKQACQKLNCKPISKVLKQIQELKDLTQRNECLDLKGEKLDYKACESLEEILKRVKFKVIDLEQTNLDEDGASALFDMIEYYESATHLNISFNKHIGTRGWQAAAHMMRKTSSLQYLDARNTPLLDHSAPFVARALRISGSLVVLHLENAGLSGRPLMLLATALKMNMNLRELYLADNKLNGLQDPAQLGSLLKFNCNIQILDLRNNHILDSGLAFLCEGLKEQRKGLVTLVLWNNQLTHIGMGYLAAALPCTQSLETLNLGHNTIGNEGVHKLKDGLIANRSVLRLGLASTKLSCEGAVALAEFIAESPRLLRLDLRENEIKTGGLMALSLALKVNNSLLRLDLDREPKKESVKSFIETQRALLTEIQNGCKRNFILAKEKEETEEKMRLSASMAEIATEDGAREVEEDEPASAERKEDGEEKEATENKSQASSQSKMSPEINVPPQNLDSDSDTEDEDVGEVVTKSSSVVSNQTAPPTQTGVSQSPLSASRTPSPPSASPVKGSSVISGITVTETTVPAPPGTPPSPGRCISVSSPGRGHKIFMVTRVESPPEQLQKIAPAAPCQPKGLTGQQTQPPHASQTQLTPEGMKESPPAPSTDSKMTKETPKDRLESDAAQTHKPDPLSSGQSSEEAKARTLDSAAVTDPSLQTPALPSNSSSEQDAALKPTNDSENPQPESPSAEERCRGEEHEGSEHEDRHETSPNELNQSTQQPPQTSAQEHLKDEQAAEPEGTSPPNQTEDKPKQEEATPDLVPSVQTYQQTQPEDVGEINPCSQGEDQESTDESSADELFVEAMDGEVVGSSLPNGLKPEFSIHLLDSESPKPSSCVMEHVSASCEQGLEELLLEASLENGRDAP